MARISRRTVLGGSLAAPFVIAASRARAQAGAAAGGRPALTIAVAELPPGLEPASELSNVGTRIRVS